MYCVIYYEKVRGGRWNHRFFTVSSMEEGEVVATAGKWIEERITDGFGLTIKINIVTRICFIRFVRVSPMAKRLVRKPIYTDFIVSPITKTGSATFLMIIVFRMECRIFPP